MTSGSGEPLRDGSAPVGLNNVPLRWWSCTTCGGVSVPVHLADESITGSYRRDTRGGDCPRCETRRRRFEPPTGSPTVWYDTRLRDWVVRLPVIRLSHGRDPPARAAVVRHAVGRGVPSSGRRRVRRRGVHRRATSRPRPPRTRTSDRAAAGRRGGYGPLSAASRSARVRLGNCAKLARNCCSQVFWRLTSTGESASIRNSSIAKASRE